MKKIFLTLVLAVLWMGDVCSQNTLRGVLSGTTKLTFLGLDFTHAKYVGAEAFPDPHVIKNGHMKSWNSLLVLEPKKFSLQGAFKIKDDSKYETNIDDMTRINTGADVESNITNEAQQLTEAEIKKVVSTYRLTPSEGVGVVYIAENLDKRTEKLTAWVTFIDLANGSMLFTERIEGKAGGFGLRNYWAGGVSSINKAIGSTYFKKWSAQFK